jgi:outer membrane lipoprotein LolB
MAATLLLGACVTAPPRSVAPPTVATIPWPQRLARLRSIRDFQLSGRIAASHANEGFSAGVRWRQRSGAADLQLVGPLGFGAAHIELTGQQLRVTTGKGVTLDGAAAEAQLAATLGFPPPLSSLRYWVLGASDPASSAEQTLDARQRVVHLQQDGWRIDYDGYTTVQWLGPTPEQRPTTAQQLWLPRRLTVTRGDLRLKLVINAWQL